MNIPKWSVLCLFFPLCYGLAALMIGVAFPVFSSQIEVATTKCGRVGLMSIETRYWWARDHTNQRRMLRWRAFYIAF